MIDLQTLIEIERRLPDQYDEEDIKDAYVEFFMDVGHFTDEELERIAEWHKAEMTSNSLTAMTAALVSKCFPFNRGE